MSQRLTLITKRDDIDWALTDVAAHPQSKLMCLDFWAEQEMGSRHIPFVSLSTFLPPEESAEAWWVMAQDIAREWYRLPSLAFWTHKDIRIGEALEPMFEMYLSALFYYVRVFLEIKNQYPDATLHLAPSPSRVSPRAGPLALFESRVVESAVRMVGLATDSPPEPLLPREIFPRSLWKTLLVRSYNALMYCVPRRRHTVYASEYWSHIAPVMARMLDTELVLMESSELTHISWRDLLAHRIRVRHPADAVSASERQSAYTRTAEFLTQWETIRESVHAFLIAASSELDWSPVLEACTALIAYSPRVMSDYDGLLHILEEEQPGVVVERASIGGRQHHFFLLAHAARAREISSVELQHAGAIFDSRSVHSRLETDYIAAFGDVEQEQYVRNGYAKERIVPVGSPRLDGYRTSVTRDGDARAVTVRALGLDPARRVVFVAVQSEREGLGPLDFSSYDIAHGCDQVMRACALLPDVQFIFKFRPRSLTPTHRGYINELFPDGGVAISEGSPQSLLEASDIVLSGNSTLMYEAMIAQRPLILFPWKTWDDNLTLYGQIAPVVYSGEELAATLESCFTRGDSLRELVEKQQKFMSRHRFDGHSAERVATVLRSSTLRP